MPIIGHDAARRSAMDRDQPRVLLIDDDMGSRQTMRLVLNAAGWAVTESTTNLGSRRDGSACPQPEVIVLEPRIY